jgi:transposase InsO family protein
LWPASHRAGDAAQTLRARPRRRGLPRDEGQRSAIAPNRLDREFYAERPNQPWIADFTYVWTAKGWLYVAAVVDLFSRRVVGWAPTLKEPKPRLPHLNEPHVPKPAGRPQPDRRMEDGRQRPPAAYKPCRPHPKGVCNPVEDRPQREQSPIMNEGKQGATSPQTLL